MAQFGSVGTVSVHGCDLSYLVWPCRFNLSPQLLDLVQKKYGEQAFSLCLVHLLIPIDAKATQPAAYGAHPGISFDRFVRACVVIKQLSEAFGRLDTDRDGWIQINYDTFMQTVLTLP